MVHYQTRKKERYIKFFKIVDENGEPLVVWHSTNADFSIFDEKKLGLNTEANADSLAAAATAMFGFCTMMINYVLCRALQDNMSNRLYVHEVFVADKIKSNALHTAAKLLRSKPHGGIALSFKVITLLQK